MKKTFSVLIVFVLFFSIFTADMYGESKKKKKKKQAQRKKVVAAAVVAGHGKGKGSAGDKSREQVYDPQKNYTQCKQMVISKCREKVSGSSNEKNLMDACVSRGLTKCQSK